MLERLKPCPFCGGEAVLKKVPDTDMIPYYVRCGNDNSCMMWVTTLQRQTPEEAIKIWNHREGAQDGAD